MRRHKKTKSIIYVNYSPYENSGKILDYLLENFTDVFVFSLAFYHLKNKKTYNNLVIFHNGVQTEEYLLFQIPLISRFVFSLLPVRSVVTFFQILFFSYRLKRRFKEIGVFFTVNGFAAWIGSVLKMFHIVDKTVFWVWDYYPPYHRNIIILLMRRLYRIFDWISTSSSDRVVFINERIMKLRKAQGIVSANKDYPIVPLGTELLYAKHSFSRGKLVFGFIGVIKKSHGLGVVFDNEKDILKHFSNVRYEVIGSGPDEEYFKRQARNSQIKTRFYGYMEGESFNNVLRRCTIGIATYIPDASNVSYFGDPGKIKLYLSLGIPVIATDVVEFSKEIQKAKAGEIIHSNNHKEFITATKKIMAQYDQYVHGARQLAKKYYYKNTYSTMFME